MVVVVVVVVGGRVVVVVLVVVVGGRVVVVVLVVVVVVVVLELVVVVLNVVVVVVQGGQASTTLCPTASFRQSRASLAAIEPLPLVSQVQCAQGSVPTPAFRTYKQSLVLGVDPEPRGIPQSPLAACAGRGEPSSGNATLTTVAQRTRRHQIATERIGTPPAGRTAKLAGLVSDPPRFGNPKISDPAHGWQKRTGPSR